MKLVILSLALFTAPAFAATVKPTYYVGGKFVSTEVAFRAAMGGNEVLACRSVEAKASKSGTSIGLRNKKMVERE